MASNALRIFADVLPYQYSLDFEESFALPTETEDFLQYIQFVKARREHWKSDCAQTTTHTRFFRRIIDAVDGQYPCDVYKRNNVL